MTASASRAAVMGILNCTPDSFSDGGTLTTVDEAVAKGCAMVADGAAWLDIGGESSRPGALPISAELEIARILPVIRGLRAAGVTIPLSIDTTKAVVAEAALAAGGSAINDITAGADPRMFAVAAAAGCPLILMHLAGTPRTMQQRPAYLDVITEVVDYLAHKCTAAMAAGVARNRIFADPGIGFGKTVAHNLALLRALPHLGKALDLPLVVGLSRKRFLSTISDTAYPTADAIGQPLHTLIAPWCALLRVHDVAGTMHALRVAELA